MSPNRNTGKLSKVVIFVKRNEDKDILIEWTKARSKGQIGECPQESIEFVRPDAKESSRSEAAWFSHPMPGRYLPSYREWLMERAGYAYQAFHMSIEVNPHKRGGVPVLKGTRFTIAQVFAEIADGRSLPQLCKNFNLDRGLVTQLFEGLAVLFDRPYDASYDDFSPRRMLR